MAGLVHKKKLGTFSSFKAAYITSFLVILYLTINEFVSWKWNCSWDIFIRVWIYQNTQVIHRFQWIEFLKQDKLFLLYNYNHYFEMEINTLGAWFIFLILWGENIFLNSPETMLLILKNVSNPEILIPTYLNFHYSNKILCILII